jgi:hypothetical protein
MLSSVERPQRNTPYGLHQLLLSGQQALHEPRGADQQPGQKEHGRPKRAKTSDVREHLSAS